MSNGGVVDLANAGFVTHQEGECEGETKKTHAENVMLARKLAMEYQSTVTVWQNGNLEHVRMGSPSDDAEAARQGWYWLTIVRPPRMGR